MTSTTVLSPQRAIFAAEYVMLGDGAKAARAAGYAYPKQQAYKLMRHPDVIAYIETLRTHSQNKADYTIEQWFNELLGAIDDAREAKSHGPVFRGLEIVGRHIGAFGNKRGLNDGERKFSSWLGTAMERDRLELESALSAGNSSEDTARENPSNTMELSARLVK